MQEAGILERMRLTYLNAGSRHIVKKTKARGRKMMTGKCIGGVIFDIDGVLLDSMGIWKDLGAKYVRENGKTPEEGLSETLFSMSMEQGAEWIRSHYLPEQTDEEILKGLEIMLRDYYYYEVKEKPGVKALLQALKEESVRITAATSSPRMHVEKALKRNGLIEYVERIFTSSEVGSSKHSPDIYDAAAAYMGLKRREVCVFEDSLYALRTAAKVGYHTAGVYDEHGEVDQKGLRESSELYIKSYSNLPQLMEKIITGGA